MWFFKKAKVSLLSPSKLLKLVFDLFETVLADSLAVEENDIIRPEDLRVRTVAKNSARKIAIIQAIDRRVALDDLAERLGMSMEEMLEEIEAIVYSGTRLNIKYFIDEVVDPDEEFDIYDYFRHADNDSIKLAMEELGEDDYDEINVRLVRIKFHSELGN